MVVQYIFSSVDHFCEKSNRVDSSYKVIPFTMKKWHFKRAWGGLSWGGQFSSILYFSVCEIWPDRRVTFGWRGIIRRDYCYKEQMVDMKLHFHSYFNFCSYHTLYLTFNPIFSYFYSLIKYQTSHCL
jgi:hypothetical protein